MGKRNLFAVSGHYDGDGECMQLILAATQAEAEKKLEAFLKAERDGEDDSCDFYIDGCILVGSYDKATKTVALTVDLAAELEEG